jgi:TolB protein
MRGRATTLGLVLAGAVAATLASAAPSGGSGQAAPAELVFVRWSDRTSTATSEIYRIREDGSRLRRLTRNRFSDASPVWSPDGKRILFVSNRDGDDELFVMDADGRNVKQLTRNRSSDLTPQWSPDGRTIAFASDRARRNEHEIWTMRADGSRAKRLLSTANHPRWQDFQFSPAWSADGSRLVFSMTFADGNPELYAVRADGKGLKRLTFTGGSTEELGDDAMPDWSAEGRRIVFVSNRESRSSDVWTMNADGSRQRPVLRRPASDDWHPDLSPDGRRIAFAELALRTGAQSVWLMNVDGSGARRITGGAEPDFRPIEEEN